MHVDVLVNVDVLIDVDVLVDGQVARRSAVELSDPADGVRSLFEFADQAMSEIRSAGIDPLRVLGAGVAVTGAVDRARGTIAHAPYLGWAPLDIASTLRTRLDMPIVVERIANAFLMPRLKLQAGHCPTHFLSRSVLA